MKVNCVGFIRRRMKEDALYMLLQFVYDEKLSPLFHSHLPTPTFTKKGITRLFLFPIDFLLITINANQPAKLSKVSGSIFSHSAILHFCTFIFQPLYLPTSTTPCTFSHKLQNIEAIKIPFFFFHFITQLKYKIC